MFAPSAICRLVRSGRVAVCDDDLGVSRTQVAALAQDARGYLWLGTEDGPILFDGLAWSAPASLAALRGYAVGAMARTTDDRLWIAADGAGLACIDLSTLPYQIVARFGVDEGLPNTRVHCVWGERHGYAWAGTHAGLVVLDEARVQRVYDEGDGLPSATIWRIAGDARGRVWVATKRGLALIVDGVVRQDLIADGPVRVDGVHAVCCDAHERIWVALVGGAVLRAEASENGPWAFHLVHAGTARVRVLWPDGEGRVWAGTSNGVVLLEGDVVRDAWTTDAGLPAKEVRAILGDGDGRVWAGTMTGLILMEDRATPVYALPEPDALVFASMEDGRGRMWLGTNGGLVALDQKTRRPIALPPLPPSLAAETVYALRLDGAGLLWIGTERDGLYALDPDSGAIHAHVDLAKHVPVLCLVDGRQLWAGMTGCGLVCVDVETKVVLHCIGSQEGLPEEHVQAVRTDARGRVWAGSWSGWLACIDPVRGAVLSVLRVGDGKEPTLIVTDMDRDATGMLWICTHGGGLIQVDPEGNEGRGAVVRALTIQDDLPTDLLYACRVDDEGHLWLGTRRGVARYTPSIGRCIVAGRSLGLPSEECNAHALHLDERGDLWVGTVQGVGVVATATIPEDVPPCMVHLTGFSVLGQERTIAPSRDLEIEDSDYDLSFSYGAVSFTASPQVVYRTWLEGLEAAWSAPTPNRVARYTNLRPGAYVFRVAARNWGGQWSTPVEVPFQMVHDRQAQALQEALQQERIDKEVALATAAVFERLALQDGLTGLLNRRALDERLIQEMERTQRHGHTLAVALADVDHFKRINDTYGHLLGDEVLKAVARICQAAVRGGDIVGRYGGEEIALVLPETTAAEAMALCERVRHSIEVYDWDSIAVGLRVTLSIGIAARSDASQPADLLTEADTYLYGAKQSGRNRTHGAPLSMRGLTA